MSNDIEVRLKATDINASKKIDKATKSIKNMGATAKKTATSLKGLGIAAAFYATSRAITSLTNAYSEQEDAERRLAQAMKTTNHFTDLQFESYKKYASALQDITAFGDETIIGVMALLQTFKLAPDILKKATAATLDLSAAVGMDLQSAAILMGKAAVGETGTLSKYGIIIDKVAFKARGFQVVLDEINTEFGGQAQELAKTYSGIIRDMKGNFGDLKEVIAAGIVPALSTMAKELTLTIKFFKKVFAPLTLTIEQKQIEYINGQIKALKEKLEDSDAWIDFWEGAGAADKARVRLEGLKQELKDLDLAKIQKNQEQESANIRKKALQEKIAADFAAAEALKKKNIESLKIIEDYGEGVKEAWYRVAQNSAEEMDIFLERAKKGIEKITEEEWMIRFGTESLEALLLREEKESSLFDQLKNWKESVSGSGEVWQKYTDTAGSEFLKKINLSSSNVAIAWAELIIEIANVLQSIIELPIRIVDAVSSLFNAIGDFGSLLTDALDNLIDSFFNMISGLGDIFIKLIPKIITLPLELLKAFTKALPILINAIVESIPIIIEALISSIPLLIAEIMRFIPILARNLIEAIPKIVSGTFQGIEKGFRSIRDAIFGGTEIQTIIVEGIMSEEDKDRVLDLFEKLIDKVDAYQEKRERSAWGLQDFANRFKELTAQMQELNPDTQEYYEKSILILEEQFEIAQKMEQIQREELRQLRDVHSSIGDLILELTGGELAPVQSVEFFEKQYQYLLNNALTAIWGGNGEAITSTVNAFEEFIPKYLEFVGAAGNDYATLVSSTISDLQKVQGLVGVEMDSMEKGIWEIVSNTGDTNDKLINVVSNIAGTNFKLGDVIDHLADQISIMYAELQATNPTQAVQVAAKTPGLIEQIDETLLGGAIGATTDFVQDNIFDPVKDVISTVGDWFGFADGGLTSGISIAGEKGSEWIVPTYEPERSKFLRDVGADPQIIGASIARSLRGNMPIENQGNININLFIDGREISGVIAEKMTTDFDLIEATRQAVAHG